MPKSTSVLKPVSEREALIRSVLGHLPQAVIYQIEAQPGGARHFTYLSGAVSAIFACTPEEAIADPRRIYDTIAREDRERLAEEEERCLRELVPFKAEIRVRARSREERWIHASSAPRRRGDGTIIWDGVMVDVSERKRAEEALRRSRQSVDSLLENSPLAVVEWSSADYRIVRWSDQATRVFGWTAEETLGKRIDELPWIHPEDRHLVEKVSDDMLSGARPRNVNRNRNIRKDGAVIHCEWYNSTLRDADGRFSVLSLVLDVTERKLAEEALREAEASLRAAVTNAALTPAQADGELRYTWIFNPHPDFDAAAVIGKRDDELEDSEGARSLVALKRRVLETGAGTREEVAFARSDGVHVYDIALEPVRDDHGAVVGVTSAAFDVTARKRSEEALRQANERLREADRAKNEFLAVLSHELRNPLAPIKNSLYILDRAAPGGEQARRAQATVARQVDQLSRLVDDLLDVTRIARDKLTLQLQRLELNELVRRTLEDYRPTFEEAGVGLHLETAPSPLFVNADGHRIAQVVGNLLHNAAKFTPRGGRVAVEVASDAIARAVVSVADTGVGLTPEMTAHVFEPFMQAQEALDRTRGGLGLGLALVKGVVELHGGQVSASSAGPGQGSRFVIWLPLDLTRPVAVERRAAPRGERHRRVLVIEDNVDAAESLREVLQLQGHEVAVAYDGTAGITRAREFHPEVVLCDIGLPGMDGYAVARAFRADEALRDARLVALSGHALAEDLQRATEAGFEQHLTKPPRFEKLAAVLAVG